MQSNCIWCLVFKMLCCFMLPSRPDNQTWVIYTNGLHRKLYELAENFPRMVIMKFFFPNLQKFKKFHHLKKNLQELLIYKLLSESSFNLCCLLVSLVCVLASEWLKIATFGVVKSLNLLLLLHCFYISNYACPLLKSLRAGTLWAMLLATGSMKLGEIES